MPVGGGRARGDAPPFVADGVDSKMALSTAASPTHDGYLPRSPKRSRLALTRLEMAEENCP